MHLIERDKLMPLSISYNANNDEARLINFTPVTFCHHMVTTILMKVIIIIKAHIINTKKETTSTNKNDIESIQLIIHSLFFSTYSP